MEDFGERLENRHVVGVDLHEVGHVVPPFLNDLEIFQAVGGVVVSQFLKRKERQAFLVEVDGIIKDSGVTVRLGELRPDFVVALFVFIDDTGFEFHFKSIANHQAFPSFLVPIQQAADANHTTVAISIHSLF